MGMIPGPRDSLLYLRGSERYMRQGKFSSCVVGMASHTIPKGISKGKGGGGAWTQVAASLDTDFPLLGCTLPSEWGAGHVGLSLRPSSA